MDTLKQHLIGWQLTYPISVKPPRPPEPLVLYFVLSRDNSIVKQKKETGQSVGYLFSIQFWLVPIHSKDKRLRSESSERLDSLERLNT